MQLSKLKVCSGHTLDSPHSKISDTLECVLILDVIKSSENTTEEILKESFGGSVWARLVTDQEIGSSKGFGFVDFNCEEDATATIEDGEIDGNKATLDQTMPKVEGGFGGHGRR